MNPSYKLSDCKNCTDSAGKGLPALDPRASKIRLTQDCSAMRAAQPPEIVALAGVIY
jgi:hypothetical protein